MHIDSHNSKTVFQLKAMGLNVAQGCVNQNIQKAAEMRFPLPYVVYNSETKEVYVGADILVSLFEYESNQRHMTRRIEETQLMLIEIYNIRTDEDRAMLISYLGNFEMSVDI